MDIKKEWEDWSGLVEIIVRKMITKSRGLAKFKDDLIGEGELGLAKAIETFDETRGMKKSSYYSLKVRGFIKDYIKRESKLSAPEIDVYSIDSHTPSVEDQLIEKEDQGDGSDSILVEYLEPKNEIDRRIYRDLILESYLTQRELAEELGLTLDVIKKRKRKLLDSFRKQLTEGL